jgi:hypothetical protein
MAVMQEETEFVMFSPQLTEIKQSIRKGKSHEKPPP